MPKLAMTNARPRRPTGKMYKKLAAITVSTALGANLKSREQVHLSVEEAAQAAANATLAQIRETATRAPHATKFIPEFPDASSMFEELPDEFKPNPPPPSGIGGWFNRKRPAPEADTKQNEEIGLVRSSTDTVHARMTPDTQFEGHPEVAKPTSFFEANSQETTGNAVKFDQNAPKVHSRARDDNSPAGDGVFSSWSEIEDGESEDDTLDSEYDELTDPRPDSTIGDVESELKLAKQQEEHQDEVEGKIEQLIAYEDELKQNWHLPYAIFEWLQPEADVGSSPTGLDDHWARLETRIGDIEADLQKVKTYVDAVVGTSLDGYTAVQHIKGSIIHENRQYQAAGRAGDPRDRPHFEGALFDHMLETFVWKMAKRHVDHEFPDPDVGVFQEQKHLLVNRLKQQFQMCEVQTRKKPLSLSDKISLMKRKYLNFFWGLKAQERELLDENIKIFFNDLTDTDSVIDILQEELQDSLNEWGLEMLFGKLSKSLLALRTQYDAINDGYGMDTDEVDEYEYDRNGGEEYEAR